jgi:hypothetical protein
VNNANAASQESALVIMGGLVAEVDPINLPEGSAPICCDIDFTIAEAGTRDGIVNVYTYAGSDEETNAGLGVNVSVPEAEIWTTPNNITKNMAGTYASVTLNEPAAPPTQVTGTVTAGIMSGTFQLFGYTPVAAGNTFIVFFYLPIPIAAIDISVTDNQSPTPNTYDVHVDTDGVDTIVTATTILGSANAFDFIIDTTVSGGGNSLPVGVAEVAGVTRMDTPAFNKGVSVNFTCPITTTGGNELIIAFGAGQYAGSQTVTFTESGSWAIVQAAQGEELSITTGFAMVAQGFTAPGTYTAETIASLLPSDFRMAAIGLVGAGGSSGGPSPAVSQILQVNTYGLTVPLSSSVLGLELQVTGHQTAPTTVLSATPISGGEPLTFSMPSSDGTVSVGGPGNFFGLPIPTPAQVNNGGFGFNITAADLSGDTSTIDLSAAFLKVWYTPPGLKNFDWVGTYEQTNGSVFTLALDNNGVIWQEDVANTPDVLTPIYTAIEPDTFAKGVTIDDREFLALSDLQMGTDMPRQYNGQWVDRVSQVGPGLAPAFGATSQQYDIVAAPNGLTQPAAVHPFALLWSTGPGNSKNAGNVITIYYGTPGSSAPGSPADPNIVAGNAVYLAGFSNLTSGASPNGTYIVASVQTTRATGSPDPGIYNTFTVQGPSTQLQDVFPNPPGTYNATIATMTLTAPAPGIQVGTQVSLAGDTVNSAGWDKTWTILNALNAAQLTITSTSLSGNVATYDYSLITGTNPTSGEQVTVTGTTNGNGIFNVVNAIISAASPGTFSLPIDSPDIPPAAESTGQGVVNGTKFQFDPGTLAVGTADDPILGNSGGGHVVQPGGLGSGTRMGTVMFLTRNGFLTAPAPPATFTVNEGANSITATNVPIGPPNVIARVIALTGANGAFFFWIPTPVTIQNPGGQPVTYSSTVIQDNTSTQVTLNITDAVLLAAASIDSQGSNNFEEIELGSSTGFIAYSQRLFAWGEENKVQNFINMSFDGGYLAASAVSPLIPAGWTLDVVNGIGGTLLVSPLFGNAYYIQNTTGGTEALYGMIEQSAALDANKVPILTPQTQYGVRVTASIPSGLTTGNLVVDLFSPSFGAAFGTFTIPFASLTESMQIITGNLLTTAFVTQVPVDLLLRVYASGIGNGADVEVDRLEVFDLSQPILSTQLRGSYFDNFEAFDDVTGNLGVAVQNQQPVRNAFELFDNLYIVKSNSFVSTSDNGVTEPDGWEVKEISNKVGTPSINGVDYGEGWALIASQAGLYIFEGGKPQKISPEIDPLWQSINWEFGYTLWLRNDTDNRRILIGVPIPTPNQWMPEFPVNAAPQQPNVVLMCSYKELMTAGAVAGEGPVRQGYTGQLRSFQLGRRWSTWSIEAAYADFIQREDTTTPVFFCGDTNSAKIYQQLSGYYFDDGEELLDLYVTYPFLKTEQAQQIHAGLHELEATYASMMIAGGGNINISILTNTLDGPYADTLDPLVLGNPPAWGDTELPLNEVGNRFFVQFETKAPGDWFKLSRFVLTVGENPWAPCRGLNE